MYMDKIYMSGQFSEIKNLSVKGMYYYWILKLIDNEKHFFNLFMDKKLFQ